jgi:hypothetical protein
MIPTQAEVDKCTHIVNKKYLDDIYCNFSDAEKQKLWQLHHPGQTPGTDASLTPNKHKVTALRSKMDDDDDNESLFGDDANADEAKKGSNRDNSALKRKKLDK